MRTYKRNQVEEAISRTLGEQSTKPSPELLGRIKRLLDTDRRTKPQRRLDKAPFAFYSGNSPGRGVEVQFSDYEAFALLVGLRMLENGWPQSFVVMLMRRGRHDLEVAHRRIMKGATGYSPTPTPARGDMAFSRGFFIAVLFKGGGNDLRSEFVSLSITENPQGPMKLLTRAPGQSISVIGLGNSAQALATCLMQAEPRPRGRS